MNAMLRLAFLASCFAAPALGFGDAGRAAPSTREVKSSAGFVATEVENGEEAGKDTVITKEGKVLASVRDAAPVSFSPDGRLLLLCEAMADDDCRHFLLNVAAGEFRKDPRERLKWIIGGRYVTDAEWSEDGSKLTLTTADAFGGGRETIEIAKFVEAGE
jgi:Tol biopolymer transport system component